jgi:hypothetical protein
MKNSDPLHQLPSATKQNDSQELHLSTREIEAKLPKFFLHSEESEIGYPTFTGVSPRPDQLDAIKRAVHHDLEILEQLVKDNLLDHQSKCGTEIEYVLIDSDGRPLPYAQRLLALDETLQKELSTCNIEATTEPVLVKGEFLRQLETQVLAAHERVTALAHRCDCLALLVGVLPSYQERDFFVDHFGSDRYRNLNRALLDRGDVPNFHLKLSQVDQLDTEFPSILIQSLNTSFQLHLSVSVDRLPLIYNICQLASAPLLSVAGNSSLVLGNRVWQESRIPIWEQAVDCGGKELQHVFFGTDWIRDPLTPLKDLEQFSALVVPESLDQASPKVSGAPELGSLRSLNGTVWRWNRLCYGTESGGPGHLRVENRYLPAGPTITDMIANAAYFYGLIHGLEQASLEGRFHDPASSGMDFACAERNFRQAAEFGLGAEFDWIDGRKWRAQELNLKLLEIAAQGLDSLKVPEDQRNFYLGIIRERVVSGQTGAVWQINSFGSLIKRMGAPEALSEISTKMFSLQNQVDEQGKNSPVHTWKVLS